MAPVLASCNADGTVNGTIAFIRSRLYKLNTIWLLWPCDDIGTGVCITWCHWHKNDTTTFLGLRKFKWDTTWLFCHLIPLTLPSWSYDATSIINGTIAFLSLWQFYEANVLVSASCDLDSIAMTPLHSLSQDDQNEVHDDFLSCDTITTIIGIMLTVLSVEAMHSLGPDD